MGRYKQPDPVQQREAYLRPLRMSVSALNRKISMPEDSKKNELIQTRNVQLDRIYFERKRGSPPTLGDIFSANPWLYNLRLYSGDYSDLVPLDAVDELQSNPETNVYVG